jgi:hypothetical protein
MADLNHRGAYMDPEGLLVVYDTDASSEERARQEVCDVRAWLVETGLVEEGFAGYEGNAWALAVTVPPGRDPGGVVRDATDAVWRAWRRACGPDRMRGFRARFPLGSSLHATPAAVEALGDEDFRDYVMRHAAGDWGMVSEKTVRDNNGVVAEGFDPTRPGVVSCHRSRGWRPVYVTTGPGEGGKPLTILLCLEDFPRLAEVKLVPLAGLYDPVSAPPADAGHD